MRPKPVYLLKLPQWLRTTELEGGAERRSQASVPQAVGSPQGLLRRVTYEQRAFAKIKVRQLHVNGREIRTSLSLSSGGGKAEVTCVRVHGCMGVSDVSLDLGVISFINRLYDFTLISLICFLLQPGSLNSNFRQFAFNGRRPLSTHVHV